MTPATRALVVRVLTWQEAGGRAALAAAQRALAGREAAVAALEEGIAREQGFAAGHGRVAAAPMLAAWRAAAGARLEGARADAMAAEAACDAPRAALAETLRTRLGFDTLMERRDAEQARAAARRDPLVQVMVLREARGAAPDPIGKPTNE